MGVGTWPKPQEKTRGLFPPHRRSAPASPSARRDVRIRSIMTNEPRDINDIKDLARVRRFALNYNPG